MNAPLFLLALICAAQPPAMAAVVRPTGWPARILLSAAIVTWVAVVVLAWIGDPLLSALDVSPPTFRLAASVVLGVWAIRWLVFAPVPLPPHRVSEGEALALGVVALSTPALVLLAIAGATEHGVVLTAGWLAIALAVTLVAQLFSRWVHPWLLRAATAGLAAVAIVIAISTGIDAARTV